MSLNFTNGRILSNISQYTMIPNESVVSFGSIVPEEDYLINGTESLICAEDSDGGGYCKSEWTLINISLLVGRIGSGISITTLSFYLMIFTFLPTLRSLPGYNIAALSAALLLGYFFLMIGHIKQVLGLPCVISAILHQYFFLTAFFCMNVMAFDVWRSLKLATEKLIIGSQNICKRQFLWYSLYAWGCPLAISAVSVVFDNAKGIPDIIRPHYGKVGLVCLSASKYAKTLFFAAPAFTLLIINIYFFIRSSYMISSNTLKCTNDQTKQTAKLTYVLYVRLALMMGLTYLMGAIGWISQEVSENLIVWFIFDAVNSLQGLFLFLIVTCQKKVIQHLKAKVNSISNGAKRNTTFTAYCSDSDSKQLSIL